MNACLNPTCERKTNCRGLCMLCYQTAGRLVRAGRTTWDELEAKGKCKKNSRVTVTDWLLSKS